VFCVMSTSLSLLNTKGEQMTPDDRSTSNKRPEAKYEDRLQYSGKHSATTATSTPSDYVELYTTYCSPDSQCMFRIEVDVNRIDRKRSMRSFNKASEE
jgi:hypothetical protein